MCLAIYSPKGNSILSNNDIVDAWNANPDGAGIAINYGKKIVIMKGFMELNDLLTYININENNLKNHDVLMHFRWTTSGGTKEGLTHPFPISSSNKALTSTYYETEKALIHNGVLFNPSMTENFSDTAIFTKWIKIFNPSLAQIEKRASGDRLALMDLEGVKLIGKWEQEIDGNFYSNSHWRYKGCPTTSLWDESYLNDEYCPCCASLDIEYIGANTETFECMDCATVFNKEHYIAPTLEDIKYLEDLKEAKKAKKKKDSIFLDDELEEIYFMQKLKRY